MRGVTEISEDLERFVLNRLEARDRSWGKALPLVILEKLGCRAMIELRGIALKTVTLRHGSNLVL
jgi:hypothetical protein